MKEIYSSSRSYAGLSRTDDTADLLRAVLIIIQHRQYLGLHAWGGTADQTPRESFPNIESFLQIELKSVYESATGATLSIFILTDFV